MLRIAVINIPFRTIEDGKEVWITVPPQGYGGIQWMVAVHVKGLLSLGHQVTLLGAPGSKSISRLHEVAPVATMQECFQWLTDNHYDIVHDFSNGAVFSPEWIGNRSWISTHHFTGVPKHPANTVYVSRAQAVAIDKPDAPVIPIPVLAEHHVYSVQKKNFLLFLGRVSPWKGTYEAARFAALANIPLVIAGPTWDVEYANKIRSEFSKAVLFIGEVGGKERIRLLSEARAILVMSQAVPGPWGDLWCEPGATVVGEAAVSGTAVISSDNGCLAEIVPEVGRVLRKTDVLTTSDAQDILQSLPSAETIRAAALAQWDYIRIAKEYEALYREVKGGRIWS